jgi:hypothetical protein
MAGVVGVQFSHIPSGRFVHTVPPFQSLVRRLPGAVSVERLVGSGFNQANLICSHHTIYHFAILLSEALVEASTI